MLIGGIHKNSLIDYPGEVSCVIFFKGCNFSCPYCHNPDLVKTECFDLGNIKVTAALEFLEKRTGLLDAVVLSGGEPTIHSDIASLCETIKQMGFKIKLDTNGSRPSAIEKLISSELVDYIAMDIKGNPYSYLPELKADTDNKKIIQSIEVIMRSQIAYEFRTTCLKPFVDIKTIELISKTIQGAPLYSLQKFNNEQVLDPPFFENAAADFSPLEMVKMKALAERWVLKCTVR